MDIPAPIGPSLPTRFFYGVPPSASGAIVTNNQPRTLWLVTGIDVVWLGGGGGALIEFSVNGVGADVWASAPSSSSLHTEQYRGGIVLQNGESLWASGGAPQWNIHAFGYRCNDPQGILS